MTMTPLPRGAAPAQAPYGVPPTAPTGAPVPAEAAAGFLALFLAAMPQAGATDPLTGAPVPGALVPEGTGSAEEAAEAESNAKDAAAALLLGDPAMLSALGLVPVTNGPVMAGAGTTADAPSPAASAAAAGVTVATTGPLGGEATSQAGVTAPAPGTATDAAQPPIGGPETGTTTETGTGSATELAKGTTTGSDATAPTATATSAAVSAESSAPAPGASATGQSIAGLTATTAASAPRTDVPAGPQAPAPAVAAQVFPEVSRLVSRGDGTHRLTMTLSPEALGDVRVVLTVRNGEVTVTFAAGSEAQQALMESAPELRRLLELTGATESRISLRDPAGTPATTNGQSTGQASTGQPGTEQQQAAGQDSPDARRDPQDHHARTREGQIATDGTHRGTGATRLPHDPVTDPRPAGVDVTV